MNIYKRSGSRHWWVKIERGGKVVRKSTGTANRRDAQRFADALASALHGPTLARAIEILKACYDDSSTRARIPITEAWQTYADIARSVGKDKVAEKTWRLRRERLERFVRWLGDNRPNVEAVDDVTGAVATEYARALADEGRKAKTRQNILGEFSTIWKLLAKASDGLGNPWHGLAPINTDSKRLDSFTDDQLRDILAAAERIGKGWPLACRLGLETGLRYGDIATLRWEDIDLDAAILRTAPNKTRRHGITVAVPLMPATVDTLRRAHDDAMRQPEGSTSREFVLPQHAALYGDESRGAYDALNFAEVLTEAGVSGNHTFHSFRHTFRTRLSAAGVDTETAMRLCGHTSAAMSARYDHDEHLSSLRAAVEAANKSPAD